MLVRFARTGIVPDPDYALNHFVNRIPLVGARLRAYSAFGVKFDDISSANISLDVEMWVGRRLSMGPGSSIGQRCYIDARGGIRMDSHASISREAALLTATHMPDDPDFTAALAPIHLAQGSWIGVRALLMPGVCVGEGAIVGAGAVVTSDVAPYEIVAGVPARTLRKRAQPVNFKGHWRPNWY